MSFTNPSVNPADLPLAADLHWIAMPPEHRREILAQSSIVLGMLLVAAVILAVVPPFPPAVDWFFGTLVPAFILLAGLSATWVALKRVRLKAHAVRTHDIAYRSGLFWRKVVVLPFNRVQHMEVTSGPLQRRFGIATLKFYTAGGKSVDLKIDGILVEDAERLRESILASTAFAGEVD